MTVANNATAGSNPVTPICSEYMGADQLAIIYGPGVLILVVVAIAILSRYPLTRARHAEIQEQLAERTAQRDLAVAGVRGPPVPAQSRGAASPS